MDLSYTDLTDFDNIKQKTSYGQSSVEWDHHDCIEMGTWIVFWISLGLLLYYITSIAKRLK